MNLFICAILYLMRKLIELITEEVSAAFAAAGYRADLGRVTVSNRPDLCEFQCNGAMALAKEYGKAPFMIADDVAEKLGESKVLESAVSVKPGFLNLKVSPEYLRDYLDKMTHSSHFGLEREGGAREVIVDYGGPNIAKPLHVGHLRAAVIGESIKRIQRYIGNHVTGDIHMGDWGLQMGLVITEVKHRQPDLPYFDEAHTGPYPKEAPFTVSELEEIYPTASAKSKEDPAYHEEALLATKRLQEGDKGYRALWKHIVDVSVADLKKNYRRLNVDFDLWWGESTVHDAIPPMVEYFKQHDYAHESDGALVIDVAKEDDTKEIPPCIVLKSDGAALYATTDLATLDERMKQFRPDYVIYVVDKRQDMHFLQVFRAAKKTKLVLPETDLTFVGFGTVNGKDGKPFKTREGGIMRLESLINEIEEGMRVKIKESNPDMPEEEIGETAHTVALAALKYGDLSNQPSKDYVFDVEKFSAFEGDTGPYILYTIVRIKSILKKYEEAGGDVKQAQLNTAQSDAEKTLALTLTAFTGAVEAAAEENMPSKLCSYIYDLANAFNSFYHGTKILVEEDAVKKEGYIALLHMTKKVLETGIDLLGFSAPERM